MQGDARAGFTLIEVAVALAVAAIVAVVLIGMIAGAFRLQRSTTAFEDAHRAVTAKIEELKGVPWDAKLDEALNAGTTTTDGLTYSFALPGLERTDGSDAGQVTFFSEAAAERVFDRSPLDLDDDGTDSETEAPRTDFIVLPVRVRAVWRDPALAAGEERSVEVDTVLYRMKDQ